MKHGPGEGLMRRRKFFGLVGGAVLAPLAVRAEGGERMRRIGVLIGNSEGDGQSTQGLVSFRKNLEELGWVEGRNLQIDVRWGQGQLDRIEMLVRELIALRPDVLLAHSTPVSAAMKRATSSIPVVFIFVSDPVGSGLISSLPHPGGNITGFINIEASLGGKWAELLKEVSPGLDHAAILFNPETAPYFAYYVEPFKAAARSLGIEPVVSPVRSSEDIESAITMVAAKPNGSLVVAPDIFIDRRDNLQHVRALAARFRMPVVYPYRFMVNDGGLISYGIDQLDLYRHAPVYVDRVLRGANPADLPVQLPTKFEMSVNLKIARELGLTLPATLLGRADEVIE
jgi:putative tryptophan/tyrosine transport system substrate-binding protein